MDSVLLTPDPEETTQELACNVKIDFIQKWCSIGVEIRFFDKDIRFIIIVPPGLNSPCADVDILELSVSAGYRKRKRKLHIKSQSPELLVLLLNGFRRLLYNRLRDTAIGFHDRIEVLNSYQPILYGWLDVIVTQRQGPDRAHLSQRLFCILDMEAMCLYAEGNQEYPTYEINFWLQAGPRVVERVLQNRMKDRITLETAEVNIEINNVVS